MSISGGGCRFDMSCYEIVRMIIVIVLLCNSWRIVLLYLCLCVCVHMHSYFVGDHVIN